MQTTNPAWQRRNNLAVLARAVWQNPGQSRWDLDRRFQIDKSSISRLVSLLVASGLVEAGGPSTADPANPSTRGGRPRVALRIRADFGQVWGLALWPDKARVTILNAGGERLMTQERLIPSYDGDFDAYLSTALGFAASLGQPLNLPLLGVGVGVPGWVDFDAGRIVESAPFGVADLEPKVGRAAGLPVLWENDANCGAWSCQPQSGDVSEALYVLGRSLGGDEPWAVGFGLVIAGRLHRGWRHRAGETFSTLAVPDQLLGFLRFASDFLDPKTIYLGGDLKSCFTEVQAALDRVGWAAGTGLLQGLPASVDEVSLGAAQLVLDELFQLPSTHRHSLLRGYGSGVDDPLWRGVQPGDISSITKVGR